MVFINITLYFSTKCRLKKNLKFNFDYQKLGLSNGSKRSYYILGKQSY